MADLVVAPDSVEMEVRLFHILVSCAETEVRLLHILVSCAVLRTWSPPAVHFRNRKGILIVQVIEVFPSGSGPVAHRGTVVKTDLVYIAEIAVVGTDWIQSPRVCIMVYLRPCRGCLCVGK